ncbi:MAG: phosphatidate cytidylyltransferase [Clostridia bacterium]|nr:phosphatidate cytidylyltransferase [Clostridia bacterium]
MLKRILTALVMIVVVFGFILGLRQIHPAILAGFIAVVTIAGAYEMCDALAKAEYKIMKWINLCAAVVITVLTYFFGYLALALSITAFVLLELAVFTFDHKYELKDVFASIFILFYPILPMSLFIIMNNLEIGLYAILLTIFIPVFTDTMAYFSGMLIGGKKLCPEISPKKTIAGGIGGIVGAIIGALLIFVLFDVTNVFASFKYVEEFALTDAYWKSALIYIALGIIAGPICEIGDLIASWIKRKAGIKDYGSIFPGHGGFMDRLDSVIVSIPIVLCFAEIITRI